MSKLSRSSRMKSQTPPGEEHYHTLFEQLPHPVWLHDFSAVKREFDTLRSAGIHDLSTYLREHPDETVRLSSLPRIVEMNRNALLFFGVSSKEDLPSQTPLINMERTYEQFRQELVALFNGNTTFSAEIETRSAKGENLSILLDLVVLPEAVNTLSRVIITFTDITKQRHIQEELRDIARVPEENPMPVMRTRENSVLVYANPASAVLMRTLGLRIGAPLAEPLLGTVNAALAANSSRMVNVTCNEKIYEIQVVPDVTRRYVNLYARDVTLQVRMEESLRKKEEGYRTMVAHAEEPMVLLDLNGNIIGVSPKLAHALRYSPEEMEGMYGPRLVDAADLVSIAQKFAEFRTNAPLPMADTFRLQRRGGGSVWITATATVVNFGEETEKYLMKCDLLDVPSARRYY